MSALTLTMPRRSGARSTARAFVETALPLPAEPAEGVVTLDARDMEASSQSFADELVGRVLSDWRARTMVVLAPTPKFASCLRRSAEVREVSDRLSILDD